MGAGTLSKNTLRTTSGGFPFMVRYLTTNGKTKTYTG